MRRNKPGGYPEVLKVHTARRNIGDGSARYEEIVGHYIRKEEAMRTRWEARGGPKTSVMLKMRAWGPADPVDLRLARTVVERRQ